MKKLISTAACSLLLTGAAWAASSAQAAAPQLTYTQVLVADQSGTLHSLDMMTGNFLPTTVTDAVAASGGAWTTGRGPTGNFYVSRTGGVFEGTLLGWQPCWGATQFADVSEGGGITLAVNGSGMILRKTGPQMFDYVEQLQVRSSNGSINPAVHVDVCDNAIPYVVAQDHDNDMVPTLYRLADGSWKKVPLTGINPLGGVPVRVTDVGCDKGGVVITASTHFPAGVYKQNLDGTWTLIAAGGSQFEALRVDMDRDSNVWFVGQDSFNGTRLWKVQLDGTGLQTAGSRSLAPVDVGS